MCTHVDDLHVLQGIRAWFKADPVSAQIRSAHPHTRAQSHARKHTRNMHMDRTCSQFSVMSIVLVTLQTCFSIVNELYVHHVLGLPDMCVCGQSIQFAANFHRASLNFQFPQYACVAGRVWKTMKCEWHQVRALHCLIRFGDQGHHSFQHA